MKILVDNTEVFELNKIKENVIQNEIPSEEFNSDMQRRVRWILEHKYEQCFERLKKEWDPKLMDNGVQSIPLDPDEYAELVFSQPNYKNRSQRDAEEV